MKIVFNFNLATTALLLVAAGCYREPDLPAPPPPDPDADPPAVALGERLFRDGRFSQLYYAKAGGDLNSVLAQGEPVLQQTRTLTTPLPGPYAAGGMNCAACHLVDEQLNRAGMRSYADFARRSPIPDRSDGRSTTARNTPSMVDALVARPGSLFLHFDAQFDSAAGLVEGTLTGRNFGWLPSEVKDARRHIARVIRDDDGLGDLAASYGSVPYRQAFVGAAYLPEDQRIPESMRLDVMRASDDDVIGAVANLIAAYMGSLVFSRDASGAFDGSPYDLFLRKNGLPSQPASGESPLDYARRLHAALEGLDAPQFVDGTDGAFQFHTHPFQFGTTELAGLRAFLDENRGACVDCHTPPAFSDFLFHNTGVSQEEYDAAHGAGAFAAVDAPSLAARTSTDLPKAGDADFGLWHVYANPTIPDPQSTLHTTLCAQLAMTNCTDDAVLPLTLGRFKTPGLRDLGHSQPYMHDGALDSVDAAVARYPGAADAARAGTLRNADPILSQIHLTSDDAAALAAFLRSLDEDYH